MITTATGPMTFTETASRKINSDAFRFPAYRPEIKLVERLANARLLAEIDRSGFMVTRDDKRDGFVVTTIRGSVPSFAGPGGFLSTEDARKIFSRS